MFCVPWLLTWFAHSISDISKIWRIYDYLLCGESYSIIYLCSAFIVSTKDLLLEVVKEEPEGAEVLLNFVLLIKYVYINLFILFISWEQYFNSIRILKNINLIWKMYFKRRNNMKENIVFKI